MATVIDAWRFGRLALSLLLLAPSTAAGEMLAVLSLDSAADSSADNVSNGGGTFSVPEIPAPCRPRMSLDGRADNVDWIHQDCSTHLSRAFGSGTLGVTARMYVSHVHWSPTGISPDTLHAFISMADGSNDATSDVVVLMLDTRHDHAGTADDVGLCFRRDGSILRVAASPTSTCSGTVPGLIGTPCTGRGCIVEFGTQWTVEVKLVPGDFGLNSFKSFGGTVGGIIRAVDGSGPVALGPQMAGTPTLQAASPATWANFTLGVAVDVALVLDLSGSMAALACPVPCATTKIKVLQDATKLFVDNFRAFAWQADQIAIRYFKTNISEFPPSGALRLLEDPCTGFAASCSEAVKANVGVTAANGATAMGGGLQSAINLLQSSSGDPGRKPAIVLFSDGMQNVNPMVVKSGEAAPADGYSGGDFRLDNEPGHPNSNVSPAPTPTRLDGLGFKVHTIGIDATPDFVNLMNDIADETGGESQNTTDAANLLFQNFIQNLVTLLSTRSPQLVAYRRDTLSADTTTQAFTVNRGIRRILLELIWPRGKRLTFEVFKDGRDVTQVGHTTIGEFYRMFVVDLPAGTGTDEITAAGQWELRIRGEPGTAYQAAALVDEPKLKYGVGTGTEDYLVGEPIQLTAEITNEGVPVDDAMVTALVGQPGEGIGTLLSVNATPTVDPSVPPEPQATPAQAKLQRLLEDEKLWRRIQPLNRSVQLKSLGGGKYAGAFSDTDVPGPYPVTFLIAGENADIGKYRRMHTLSTVVRFGPADSTASEVEVRTIEQTPTGLRALLRLRPKDRFGNFLGPDYADQIHVVLTEGTVSGKPQDLLDGSYEVVLLLPPNRDPEITITVVEHRLFKGKVSQLRPRRFALSLHAGLSLPHGSFNATHDPGFGITTDAEYWLNRRFAMAVLLGYHRFGGETANPDLDLFHASAALEARVTSGTFSIMADVGGGIYSMSPGSTDPGVHAGAGIEFDASPTVSLGLTGRVHTVFTTGSNTTFSSLQAGGRIRF